MTLKYNSFVHSDIIRLTTEITGHMLLWEKREQFFKYFNFMSKYGTNIFQYVQIWENMDTILSIYKKIWKAYILAFFTQWSPHEWVLIFGKVGGSRLVTLLWIYFLDIFWMIIFYNTYYQETCFEDCLSISGNNAKQLSNESCSV